MNSSFINPSLVRYNYLDSYTTETPIYQTTETRTPGDISVSTSVYGGIASTSITQGPSTSHFSSQVVGYRKNYFVRFKADSGHVVSFEVSDIWSAVDVIWLKLERQYWAFQFKTMQQPRLVWAFLDFSKAPVFLGDWVNSNSGFSLSDEDAIFKIKSVHYDFRRFLEKIGKASPLKLMAPEILQRVLDEDKKAAQSVHANYSDLKDSKKIFGKMSEKILHPTALNPHNTVEIAINKVLLISAPALSLLMMLYLVGIFSGGFLSKIPGGLWLAGNWWFGIIVFIFLNLISFFFLSRFMDVRGPKSFRYDKSFYMKSIAEAFDESIYLGGVGRLYDNFASRPYGMKTGKELAAEARINIHKSLHFIFCGKSSLLERSKLTKLTQSEIQNLIFEIDEIQIDILEFKK